MGGKEEKVGGPLNGGEIVGANEGRMKKEVGLVYRE